MKTIADTNVIEAMTFLPDQGENGTLRFEMQTSMSCTGTSPRKAKFITHIECDQTKVGPIQAKTESPDDESIPRLDTVWRKSNCEYHVKFAHKAGCAVKEESEPVILAQLSLKDKLSALF